MKLFWAVGDQVQCIYYLVLYSDLKSAEGISAFQTSLLWCMYVVISWAKKSTEFLY